MPLSLHCGPRSICIRLRRSSNFVHLEYFHDHVRIEHMLFDGVVTPVDGASDARISIGPGTGSS